jgi:hypothetical protein
LGPKLKGLCKKEEFLSALFRDLFLWIFFRYPNWNQNVWSLLGPMDLCNSLPIFGILLLLARFFERKELFWIW